MEDRGDNSSVPIIAQHHHRRRRRKKNYHATNNNNHPTTSESISQQDAELDREVDSYLNWNASSSSQRNGNIRKRPRRVYGGNNDSSGAPSSVKGQANNGTRMVHVQQKDEHEYVSSTRSLPILLHLREIGLSSSNRCCIPHGNHGRQVSWKQRMLQQPISQSPSTKREQIHNNGSSASSSNQRYIARHEFPFPVSSDSQWNTLQYASPTYNDDNNAESLDFDIQLHKQTWRSYTQQQKIPFSKLKTPISDAILALDRFGGYLIGIGGGGSNSSHDDRGGKCAHLMIKFFGVPSPNRLLQIQNGDANIIDWRTSNLPTSDVSPLVHAVPLLFKNSGSIENRNFPAPPGLLGYNEYESPAANTPLQILLSSDGSLGVAFLHHSTAAAWSNSSASSPTFSESPALQDEVLGTIVIFESPNVGRDRTSKLAKSFRLSNVRVGGWSSFTMRNLLWPTTQIPIKHDSSAAQTFQYTHNTLSAYMLFNDEDDGFRITWISIKANSHGSDAECEEICTYQQNKIRPTRNDIVSQSEDNIWEGCVSDPDTGCCTDDNESDCPAGLNIAFEVYLHIDALLSDILSRRQSSLFKNSPYQNESVSFMPDFFYNLVSVYPDSFQVVVVIVFSNKEKMMHNSGAAAALGVFVKINLCDQSYDELKWVQHPSCNDAAAIKKWCNSLALNWRMKECRVGVFCLDSNELGSQLDNWTCSTHEINTDEDIMDDSNVNLWKSYVEQRDAAKQKSDVKVPKDISISSLYPHCDVITNKAVHNKIPVKRIISRCSPIELIYG